MNLRRDCFMVGYDLREARYQGRLIGPCSRTLV